MWEDEGHKELRTVDIKGQGHLKRQMILLDIKETKEESSDFGGKSIKRRYKIVQFLVDGYEKE